MRYKRYVHNGFTLVEVLIAVMLVGITIASLVAANISFTMANGAGADLSTAEFLAEQIKELTTLLPVLDPQTGPDTFGPEAGETLSDYDDIDDLDDASFSPPISAGRDVLSNFPAFTQQVTVQKVSPVNFESVVDDDHPSDFVRVTVKVLLNSKQITETSWLRANIDN